MSRSADLHRLIRVQRHLPEFMEAIRALNGSEAIKAYETYRIEFRKHFRPLQWALCDTAGELASVRYERDDQAENELALKKAPYLFEEIKVAVHKGKGVERAAKHRLK